MSDIKSKRMDLFETNVKKSLELLNTGQDKSWYQKKAEEIFQEYIALVNLNELIDLPIAGKLLGLFLETTWVRAVVCYVYQLQHTHVFKVKLSNNIETKKFIIDALKEGYESIKYAIDMSTDKEKCMVYTLDNTDGFALYNNKFKSLNSKQTEITPKKITTQSNSSTNKPSGFGDYYNNNNDRKRASETLNDEELFKQKQENNRQQNIQEQQKFQQQQQQQRYQEELLRKQKEELQKNMKKLSDNEVNKKKKIS